MSEHPKPPSDPIDQGAQAGVHGRQRECWPYPASSEEREAWLEGFTGAPRSEPRDLPQS
jgi:ribosome modulation factor